MRDLETLLLDLLEALEGHSLMFTECRISKLVKPSSDPAAQPQALLSLCLDNRHKGHFLPLEKHSSSYFTIRASLLQF